MTKFPLVRDLQVDRSRMFNDLKKVKAWIELDETHDWPRPTSIARTRRRGIPAFSLHDVRLLHGSMPAGESPVELHRPGGDQPGEAFQPSPEREAERDRTS